MGVLDDFKLDGKVALVTGAARGLGQGIAVGLAEAGADVAGLDVASVDETGDLVRNEGRRFHAMNVDLLETNASSPPMSSRSAWARSGASTYWSTMPASSVGPRRMEFGEEDWESVIKINLSAAFYLSQAAAKHFVQKTREARSSTPPRSSPTKAA